MAGPFPNYSWFLLVGDIVDCTLIVGVLLPNSVIISSLVGQDSHPCVPGGTAVLKIEHAIGGPYSPDYLDRVGGHLFTSHQFQAVNDSFCSAPGGCCSLPQ